MFENPETIKQLEAMTDFVRFEMLCCDLLAGYGSYQGIVPQGVGRIDGGKDAILVVRDQDDVTVVRERIVFHFSLREDWKPKLWADLKTVHTRKLNPDHVVFVTNRRVTPKSQDALKADAKKTFGWDLEVLDQHWLRVPLDGEYQRLRKRYLHIEEDPRAFHDLESELDVPERHPNRTDLEGGAYYRNDVYHEQIHTHLDGQRRCLLIGKPGHGKTALAMAIGWELLSSDTRHVVFYIKAGIGRSCESWLHHIMAFDHDWITFILDDCHQAPEQVGVLLDAWPSVRKARLLLVSRPMDASSAGPPGEDFQEGLDAVRVQLEEPDETMISQIVERILKRDQLGQRDPGSLQPVLDRCRGDLYILEFLVNAWLKNTAEVALGQVPEAAILEAVYSRYLGGDRERHRRHIAAVAALSQFEIPVESRWLQDESTIAALREDAFVERFAEEVEGVPIEFLRYFHSTPARYVVEAAFRRGILGARSSDEYTVDRLASYVRSLPGNLFKVFYQLHRNERDDLQSALFEEKSVTEAVERFIGSARIPPSAAWLDGFARLVYGVSQREGEAGPVARLLVQAFKNRVGKDKRLTLFRSLDLGLATVWFWTMRKIDPDLMSELHNALDYTELGMRSRAAGVGIVGDFLGHAHRTNVDPENLRAFCRALDFEDLGKRSRDAGLATLAQFLWQARRTKVSIQNFTAFCSALDFEDLGKRSRDVGLAHVRRFLELARPIGVTPENLNAFCGGLDFKDLGLRSRGVGLATVRRFLELVRQTGVSLENRNAFCGGLDFENLGKRARGVGLATVAKFLDFARQAGVSSENLNAFCGGLDWRRLGQELGPTVNKASPLFEFHRVCSNPGITADMAKEFVDGMGWDAVHSILDAPNAPDVIAALRALLMRKCGYGRQALAQRNVLFGSETWVRSFMGKRCVDVWPGRSQFQSNYLRYALNGLRGNPAQTLSRRLHERKLELKHWNVLIHNIKLADTEFFRAELEPLVQHMPQPDLTQLLRDADMLNLSIFASRFAPDTGEFTWRPRVDLALDDLDFSTKIRSIPLIDMAHPLFTLRFLGQPAWCAALADALDRDPGAVLAKLTAADLRTLEFFLWNLLTARDELRAPALLDHPAVIGAVLGMSRGASNDQENLAALCGTLFLWTWGGLAELLPVVVPESAIRCCVEAAKSSSAKLIRLSAGLAAIRPDAIPAHARESILGGMTALRFPLEVPSQTLALERVRQWIEGVPPQ